jgi:predicted SnoaL-like aldol condensation-catalyzing enzyme
MNQTLTEKNKTAVREAFDTLFNQRDFEKAMKFWSPDYIQHSAHIPPGRDGLFNMIQGYPPTLRYEFGVLLGEDDLIMMHGRFVGGGGSANLIAADIIKMKDGLLIEHWDVLQDEVTRAESESGRPMFGNDFPG